MSQAQLGVPCAADSARLRIVYNVEAFGPVSTLMLYADLASRERAHPHALGTRIAHIDPLQPLDQCSLHGLDPIGGDKRTTDRRAFLASFRGHLAHQFLHEQLEFGAVRCCVGT